MNLEIVHQKIYEIRELKVMLDYDLAELYEVETKYLKRAVRANIERFPSDFMFQLTKSELLDLRCKFSTSSLKSHGGSRYLPFGFTEQGVAMLSTVLNNKKAIDVNISIMRTFVKIRNYALTHLDLSEQLKLLEKTYNKQFDDVFEAINYLLKKDSQQKQTIIKKKIGYKKEE
jgi:hypothetical protein